MSLFSRIFSLLFVCLLTASAPAQDLDIFGFFQSTLSYRDENQQLANDEAAFKIENRIKQKSFSVQQFNLFFRKELNPDLSVWVNFELKNTFSSEREWGTFNLEEAWLRYHHSKNFNLKGGLLIPRFNNLNEVKNRMPYLPYIIRPLIYEASISQLLPLGDFFPERAFLQAYGEFEFQTAALDYAVFIGDGETEFHNSDSNVANVQTGHDSTLTFLVGGRVGLKYEGMKLGFSATYDKDNQWASSLGDVNRFRIGGDLSFSLARFFVEGEFILLKHKKFQFANLDKSFYYATLGYNFTDAVFGYVSYNYLKDNFTEGLDNGLNGYYVGAGYRPIESMVVKGQFTKYVLRDGLIKPGGLIPVPLSLDYTSTSVFLAVSIMF